MKLIALELCRSNLLEWEEVMKIGSCTLVSALAQREPEAGAAGPETYVSQAESEEAARLHRVVVVTVSGRHSALRRRAPCAASHRGG